MKKNDVWKKHHFWILFGLVPLFVFIAVLVMSSAVGGAIEKRETEIKKEQDDIKKKSNPKPNLLIEKMDGLIKFVDSKQEGLWKGSYSPQKSLFTMPADSNLLKQLERRGLRFGDKLPNDRDEDQEFRKKEVYWTRYDTMAKSVSPTTFAGDAWETVLRHVGLNSWTAVKLTSEQIWLLLEDIWVQESLLSAISAVDAQMAEFTRVKFERDGVVIDDPANDKKDLKGPSDPLRRKFRSRIWDIELEVVREGNKNLVKGTLINTTDKLQLFGIGNTMVMRIWLQSGDKKTIQPFDFKIGGEFLPGAGATKFIKDKEVAANVLNIPRTDDHIVPPGMPVEEIVAVEQVFDSRTVPIRRIDYIALGFADSRNAASPLFPPLFIKEEAAPAAESAGGGGPGPNSGGSGSSSMRMGNMGGMGPMGGNNPNSAATKKYSGAGTVAEVIDGNKKRYIDKPTEQVRRMPVGIGVVVDQAYLQDVLLAFANSPLRFQITQVTWNRFRGSLKSDSDSGGFGVPNQNSNGGIQYSGGGQLSTDFGSGSSKGPPGGMRPSGPGPGYPTGPGNSMGGFGSTSSATTVSESQLTSGLIELKIYGIVSLYTSPDAPAVDPNAEKKDKEPKEGDPKKENDPTKKENEPKKDKGAKDKDAKDKEPKKDKDAKDKDPKNKDAKDKDPTPMAPMTTDPKIPKM